MTIKYLHDRSSYEERYDRFTIEQCRHWEDREPSEIEKHHGMAAWLLRDYPIFRETGERWRRREETINRWMEQDHKRDTMLAQARPPLVRCPSCERAMDCVYTHLNSDLDNDREWLEFIVQCKPCKQGKIVYENGSEVVRKTEPARCGKCKDGEIECTVREEGGKRYFVDTCKSCGHVEETPSVLNDEKKPSEEETERYEHDRKRFCITDEQGQRYLRWEEHSKKLDDAKKEYEQNIVFHDKLKEVQKLNIAGLEKLLKAKTVKQGYVDLSISMSPPDRQIILNFSVRDTEYKRQEYDSRKTLEKIIGNALEDTNWALMSEGVSYRLGLLTGRIRGYETEDDLQELTKVRMKKIGKKTKVRLNAI